MSPPALAFLLVSTGTSLAFPLPVRSPLSLRLPAGHGQRVSPLRGGVCSAQVERPSHRNAVAETAITQEAVGKLQSEGYVVIDDAISGELCEKALQGAAMMRKNGKLSQVQEQFALGRQDEMMVMDVWDPAWGDIPPEFQGMAEACSVLKGVAEAISRHCEPEHEWATLCAPPYMQLAVYAGNGHRYVRHLDNDPEDDGAKEGPPGLRVCDRVVTALLYFNKDWKEEDGGYIRLYRPEEGRQEEVLTELEPSAGRLVLFDSKRFFHEVLPAHRQRWALSAWMTDTSVA